MSSFLKSNQAKLAAVVAVAGVAAAAVLLKTIFAKNNDSSLAPALTEEEAIKVLRKVVEEAKKIGMPLVQQIEGFLQQIEQQNPGHQLDREKVIKTLILPHLGLPGKFESALQRAQDKVFDDFDVDEIEMEDAISYYSKQGNREIKEMEEKLKALYKTFGGDVAEEESSAEDSAGKILSAEEVVNVLGQLAERMSELTDGYIEAFKEAHGLPQTPEHITAFQHGMMELSEEAEKQLLESQGLTQSEFQKSLLANQNDPAIGSTIMRMQMENQMKLMSHGIQLQ